MARESLIVLHHDQDIACGQAFLHKSKPILHLEQDLKDKGVLIMLVLTRKLTEEIRIGDEILVKVIRTGKGSIKIGVDAPDHLRVVRGELFDEETELELKEKPVVKGRVDHRDGDYLSGPAPTGMLTVVEAARLVC